MPRSKRCELIDTYILKVIKLIRPPKAAGYQMTGELGKGDQMIILYKAWQANESDRLRGDLLTGHPHLIDKDKENRRM